MKEVISIHIGQAGIQIGDTCTQLFAQESGIQPDGTMNEETRGNLASNAFGAFFREDEAG